MGVKSVVNYIFAMLSEKFPDLTFESIIMIDHYFSLRVDYFIEMYM